MALSALTDNLGLTSGDKLVTNFTSYIGSDKNVTSDVPSLASSGTEESQSASSTHVVNDIEGVESHDEDVAHSILKTIPQRRLKRSSSDLTYSSGPRYEPKTFDMALNEFRSKDDMYHSQHAASSLSQTYLQPSRTHGRQPVVTPRNELTSGEHKDVKSFVGFRQNPRPGQPCHRSTGIKTLIGKRLVSIRYIALCSSSDSDLARASTDPKLHSHDLLSKSCIKKQAKRGTSMPPDPLQRCTNEVESKALPRLKTVSFKQNSQSSREHSRSAHKVTFILNDSADALTRDDNTHPRGTDKISIFRNNLLFPSATCAVKSSVAHPAITRTDVYVIAISPSWDARDIVNEEGPDPATPTMQTIETEIGSYEVVWDDVPSEQNIQVRARRSSSASNSLGQLSSGASHSLERLDSKISGCSGTWNSTSNSFKPTVIVFPDDDGRATSFECTIKDLSLPTPPNSHVTSVTSSHHNSWPASRSLTRTASSEDMLPGVPANRRHQHAVHDLPQSSEDSLFMPRREIQHIGRRKGYPAIARQLSSLEEANSHFCCHHDSVAIAHARLIRSERASSEPFAHQDSYMIAKKRINAGAEDTPAESASSLSKDLLTEIDDGVPEVSLSVVKEHAAQALKNNSPVSILRSAPSSANQPHIQIME